MNISANIEKTGLTKEQIEAYRPAVSDALDRLWSGNEPMTGWVTLPVNRNQEELNTIQEIADIIKDEAELLEREVFCGFEWVSMDHGIMSQQEGYERICRRLPENCSLPSWSGACGRFPPCPVSPYGPVRPPGSRRWGWFRSSMRSAGCSA